ELCYGLSGDGTIPERVKTCRHQVIEQREKLDENAISELRRCDEQLEDLFLVVQLFSYPGDYVSERPTVERLAETLDKFEEDVLAKSTARIRGARRAVATFGEAVPVQTAGRRREAAAELTAALESSVQRLLDSVGGQE
ncbi:MAG: glycerol acyltransferase, partial [Planctomycetaceae bacterium]